MRKNLSLTLLAWISILCTLSVSGQVVSNNGFFKGTFVEAGIQPSGAFGSLVSAPSDYVSATVSKYSGRVGFIADMGKDGWNVGNPKYIGDFFVPGTPYEAFSVKVNGTLYENAGSSSPQITGNVTGYFSDGTTSGIEWLGNIGNLQIKQVTSVGKNSSYILIRVYLKNTGSSTINNIYYTRSVDPDNEVDQVGSGGFETINTIEDQNPNATSTALVSGIGRTHNSYLGLGSRDCRARVAIMKTFSSDGETIYAGSGGQVRLSAKGASVSADNAIAVAFKIGNLAAGDSTALAMAYVLNAADLPPAMDETDPLFNVRADSYASGSVINVCSGSTAQLNIINGDGYDWTWSPATNLNTTTGRSVNASLTGDITYTATGVNVCGTTRSINLNLHPIVSEDPGNAGTITGPSTIYAGWNATYSVPEIPHATSYKWTIPTGASYVSGFGTNTIVVRFGTGATSGNVSVYGENSCGTGASSTKSVTLASGSALSITSDNNNIPGSIAFPVATIVDDKIKINGTETITNPRVYIDNGFNPGDILSFTSELPADVTVSYNASTGALSFLGSATPAQWQEVFRQIRFRTSSANMDDRTIKYVLGDMVSLMIGGKPHFYEYIKPSSLLSWQEARDAAASKTFFGLAGYLATITSAQENEFIRAKLKSDGWIGGSDDYRQINIVRGTTYTNQPQTEGNWHWVTGPEAGTAISTGNGTPTAVAGAYMNWSTGEPNNMGNENFIQLYATHEGKWNDLSGVAITSVPGYVVEYGGYDSDPAINVSYSRTIKNKPAPPAITVITNDSGESDTDFITSDRTLIISGTAAPNGTVRITRVGSGIVGTVTANASGQWSFDYTSTALADGTYKFTATATSGSLTSDPSEEITVVIDATAPAKPGTPALASGTATTTSEEKPSFAGTAEANTLVRLYDGTTLLGSAIADETGAWTITTIADLDEGTYSITVTATDIAGNTSVSSDAFALTVDRTAPLQPGTPVLTTDVPGYTNTGTPNITGVTEPHTTVTILLNGTDTATVTTDADGKWSYDFSPALNDNDYTVTVTATDAAGNTSATSEVLSFTVDTEAPAKPSTPVISSSHNNGHVQTGTPTIAGTAEPHATVTIYNGSTEVAIVTADAEGKWSYTFTTALDDGDHYISTTATDAAGNTSVSSESLKITVDTTAPLAPTPAVLKDSENGSISNSTPTITGEAEPGSIVTIYSNGQPVTTVTADENGKWSYTFSPELNDGQYVITTTATDEAGNTSEHSTAVTIEVDTQNPDAPQKTSLKNSINDRTNTSQPTIEGEAEPGTVITIYNNGIPIGEVTTDQHGKWSYTFTGLEDGDYNVQVTATDKAGNISQPSLPISFIVDTQSPAVPGGVSIDDVNDKGYAKNNKPTVKGTAEPGSTVTIYDNGVPVATVTVDENGDWSYTFDPSLGNGPHAIETTVTDLAGNVSAPSETISFTVDTRAPHATVFTDMKTMNGPFTATILFDKPVIDFSPESLLLDNGTVTEFTKISDTEYAVVIKPIADKEVSVQLKAGATSDLSGNPNVASNTLVVKTTFSGYVKEIFPNPAINQLNVRFEGVVPEKSRVMLVKMSGQVVIDQQAAFQSNVLKLDVSKLAGGVYTLVIQARNYMYRAQVLISR